MSWIVGLNGGLRPSAMAPRNSRSRSAMLCSVSNLAIARRARAATSALRFSIAKSKMLARRAGMPASTDSRVNTGPASRRCIRSGGIIEEARRDLLVQRRQLVVRVPGNEDALARELHQLVGVGQD